MKSPEMPLGSAIENSHKCCRRSDLCGPASTRPVEVDVRILAASSDKMDRALAEKRLHPDLYYRLSAFTVHVPPLRQRKEEIKILLRYLHAQAGEVLRPSLRANLLQRRWRLVRITPGREI